jgi:hypothetical protein
MPRTLALSSGEADGRDWPGLVAQLQREGTPRLAVRRLLGGALVLGRYQRAASALSRPAPFHRRVTGGRALALGAGMFGVALALPHRGWLLGDDPGALPAAKILNRCVRGLLAGLGRLGVGAAYFGRDFVTVDSAQAGYLSFDADAAGRTVVECVLPAEVHWWLPAEYDAQPREVPTRGFPAPAVIEGLRGVEAGTLAAALGAGFEERFGVTLGRDDSTVMPGALPEEGQDLERGSTPRAIAAGWVEARVSLRDGRLAAARVFGDFLADGAGVAKLEASLEGAAPSLEEVGSRLNAVYADGAHTLLGADLGDLAAVLLEAAR